MAFNRQAFQNDRMFGGNYKEQSEDSEFNSNVNNESNTSEDQSEDKIYTKKTEQPKGSAMSKYNVANPTCNKSFNFKTLDLMFKQEYPQLINTLI